MSHLIFVCPPLDDFDIYNECSWFMFLVCKHRVLVLQQILVSFPGSSNYLFLTDVIFILYPAILITSFLHWY